MKLFGYFFPILTLIVMSTSALAEDERVISLSASATINAEPDFVSINAGVTSEAPTAKEAMETQRKAINTIFKTLEKLGVKDENIETSNFSLVPVYSKVNKVLSSPAKSSIKSYRVNNSIIVKLNDLKKTGTVLDHLVEAGATNINHVSFGINNEEELMDEARIEAVKKLKQRAKLYADQLDVKIGKVISFSEGSHYSADSYEYAAHAQRSYSSPTIVKAGDVSVSVKVNASFELE